MIYYFLKRETDSVSRTVYLIAYVAEPRIEDGKRITKFRELESIRFFQITPDGFIRFHHDFAYEDCHFAGSKSYQKLKKEKERWEEYPIARKNYERYKKALLSIYQKHHKGINFDLVKKPKLTHHKTILW